MKTIFNLLTVCGFFCAATNVGATTITYDFFGSGEGSYIFDHYSYDFTTGVEAYNSHVNGTGVVTIRSTFTLDADQYRDSTVPEVDGYTNSDTFGVHWLMSQSSASTGSYSNSQNTSGNYESEYQGCDISICFWSEVVSMFDRASDINTYTYYDSGAIKSFTNGFSYNRATAATFDLGFSRINGQKLVTHVGDLNSLSGLEQSTDYYKYYYDESGAVLFYENYTADFYAPLTSLSIRVDTANVPEPAPLVLLGLGLLMVSARRFARK